MVGNLELNCTLFNGFCDASRDMFVSGRVIQAIGFAACNATKWSDVNEERQSL